MHPHSYTVDSLSKSQELASAILSASTPPQISAACSSTASFLKSHSPDHSRHFFSLAFPALISKLFGFGGLEETAATASQSPSPPASAGGWIDAAVASKDADLAGSVYALLAPGGALLTSISAVDRLDLVKYVFPAERLPEWSRFLLSSEKDRKVVSDLCPIFKNRVKDSIKGSISQVQLNVFEYYMFWFAYYPVCRGNNENSDNLVIKRNRRFKLESWVSSISGFSSSVSQSDGNRKVECNLYVRLLYAYLQAFVPISDLNSHQPYRSSLLHFSPSYDGDVMMQGEFIVNTLVHFWLVDNDFSPLPADLCKSFGVSSSLRSVLGETPPTAGLGEVVKLFVKYLNLNSAVQGDGNEGFVEYNGSTMWRTPRTPGSFEGSKSRSVVVASPIVHSVGSWNLMVQRPLYRFILRTFLFCPIGTSIKNASEVFSVWIMYLEPWKISLDDFLHLDSTANGSAKTTRNEALSSQDCGYSPCWQGYVLSNYLYYSSLVMHFIGFAHKFLHADVEIIVQMVLKVISILTSSKELVDLIRAVDSVFHSKQAGPGKSMRNSLYRYVPSIREQLKDWEEGLSETDADGSFLHENWNKDLRLFGDGEDGGQQLLQLFILRAEAELQAISGDNLAQNLQSIDSLKAEVSRLFGSDTIKRLSFSPEPKHHHQQQPRDDIFKPRRVGDRSSENNEYKGDWMKRPISDDEVAWVAKLLVLLSDRLNESLGLNHPEDSQVGSWSYIDVSSADTNSVCGPKDTTKVVLSALGSWFLMVGVTVLRMMRKRGLRVNLRILASKKFVMVVILYVVFNFLRRVFRHLY